MGDVIKVIDSLCKNSMWQKAHSLANGNRELYDYVEGLKATQLELITRQWKQAQGAVPVPPVVT